MALQTIKFRAEQALMRAGQMLLDHNDVRGAGLLLDNARAIVNELLAEHVAQLAIVRAKAK